MVSIGVGAATALAVVAAPSTASAASHQAWSRAFHNIINNGIKDVSYKTINSRLRHVTYETNVRNNTSYTYVFSQTRSYEYAWWDFFHMFGSWSSWRFDDIVSASSVRLPS